LGLIETDQARRQQATNGRSACAVDGCVTVPKHSGLCNSHYHRKLRYGDPSHFPERTLNIGKPKRDRNGYVSLYRPDHPDARKNGYVFEHRLVMEEVLGRRLLPSETVHHKRGVRSNNDPACLELWVKSQPAGQRVTDLVAWAKEILERYPDSVVVRLS